MKLISCCECGIVVDQDRYSLENEDFYDDDMDMKEGVALWKNNRYVAIIKCPVCENPIETDHII